MADGGGGTGLVIGVAGVIKCLINLNGLTHAMNIDGIWVQHGRFSAIIFVFQLLYDSRTPRVAVNERVMDVH